MRGWGRPPWRPRALHCRSKPRVAPRELGRLRRVGDRRRRRYDEGRTRQWRRRSASCEGNGLLTTTAMGSGESGRGQKTKATDESGRPRRQRRHHRRQQWLCPPLETTINKQRGDERGDGDEMLCEEGGGMHDNRGEMTRRHNNQIDHRRGGGRRW